MKYFTPLSLIILLIFITCQGFDNNKSTINKILSDSSLPLNETKDSGIQRNTDHSYKSDSALMCKIDTPALKAFWNKFIKAVKTKDKKVIRGSLSFDFGGLFLGTIVPFPNFMKNCDTVIFSRSDEYYGISKVTKENFDYYFDTIFNDNLIEILSEIKIDSIMKRGENKTGYSYVYTYSPSLYKFPCSHEKVMVINLFYCDKFRITIDFCC